MPNSRRSSRSSPASQSPRMTPTSSASNNRHQTSDAEANEPSDAKSTTEIGSSKRAENDNAATVDTVDELSDSQNRSTRQRRLDYFRSGIDADCEVHVPRVSDCSEQGANVCFKKFRCHRIFLATASEKLEQDVFQNKQWNGVLQINGVSPESVEIFLEFIYTFEVTSKLVDLLIIGDIFILSCAYNIPDLLLKFAHKLKDVSWPMEGIFPALNLAFRHNIYDLETACISKIVENAAVLKTQPSIMDLQIYALNYIIQLWLATEALTRVELIQLLQKYQKANGITFKNSQLFPHFTKIMKYFPSLLLDAEGLIHKY